jgi:hypothetical protein
MGVELETSVRTNYMRHLYMCLDIGCNIIIDDVHFHCNFALVDFICTTLLSFLWFVPSLGEFVH